MVTPEPAFAFCAALADALVAGGVDHACLSPGSRNTPVLLALDAHPGLTTSVHHDERSAAFFALGRAKVTGRPVLLSCTSGTAATEYLPALTEGRMAHTPLIVLTADRPPELQDRGSPQTINQTNLYGVATKWFHDTGVPDADSIDNAAHLARQAVATALEPPAGPVHLNIPLRDPLVPATRPGVITATSAAHPVVPNRPDAGEDEVRRIAELVDGRCTVIVAGTSTSPGLGAAVANAAAALGAIVLADPQSEIRFGTADPALISTADLLLAAGYRGPAAPEAVLHVGAIPTSKPVQQWLQSLGVPVVHIDDGRWHDPLGIATSVVAADPTAILNRLAKIVGPASAEFAATWRRADDAAGMALREALAVISEPAAARALVENVPAGALIVAGSSMPIRLLDSYGRRRRRPATVVANRGANGIDGAIATALGVAAVGRGPTYAFIGDLAALVDVGSLATAARLDIPCTIVALNNDGGGIFEFLPQADPNRIAPDAFTELIATPHGLRLAPIARSLGVAAIEAADLATLEALVRETPTGPRLIEVRFDRTAGPRARELAIAAVGTALSSAGE